MIISKHPMLFTLPSSVKSARYSGRNEGMELSSLFIKPISIAQHLCDTNHLTSTSLSFLPIKWEQRLVVWMGQHITESCRHSIQRQKLLHLFSHRVTSY